MALSKVERRRLHGVMLLLGMITFLVIAMIFRPEVEEAPEEAVDIPARVEMAKPNGVSPGVYSETPPEKPGDNEVIETTPYDGPAIDENGDPVL